MSKLETKITNWNEVKEHWFDGDYEWIRVESFQYMYIYSIPSIWNFIDKTWDLIEINPTMKQISCNYSPVRTLVLRRKLDK